MSKPLVLAAVVVLAGLTQPGSAQPLTTAFTFQGDLRDGGNPVTTPGSTDPNASFWS